MTSYFSMKEAHVRYEQLFLQMKEAHVRYEQLFSPNERCTCEI